MTSTESAGTGQAGQHDKFIPWKGHIDIFQIVLIGTSYLYILLRHICTSIIIDSALFYHVAADLFYSHYSHSLPCNYA